MAFQPYKAESHRKEFIAEMQAKGKLPRLITAASERYDAAYYETCPRIFPGPGGMDTVLKDMLLKSEKRINAAQRHESATAAAAHAILSATAAQLPSSLAEQAMLASGTDDDRHRQEVKAHLHYVDRQLQHERQQRLMTEHKLEKEGQQLKSVQTVCHPGKLTGTLQERMYASQRRQQALQPPYHVQQPPSPRVDSAQAFLAASETVKKSEARAMLLQQEAALLQAVQQEKGNRREAEKRLATLKQTGFVQ